MSKFTEISYKRQVLSLDLFSNCYISTFDLSTQKLRFLTVPQLVGGKGGIYERDEGGVNYFSSMTGYYDAIYIA